MPHRSGNGFVDALGSTISFLVGASSMGVEGAQRMGDHAAGDARIESELLDLTDLDLDRLAELPDSVLAASLRRVLSERVDLPQGYAGFENAL